MKTKILKNLVIIGFLLTSCGLVTREKFDSIKWRNSNLNLEENWDLRWNMMNDLRKNFELVGMTKSEIEKLLGKPESETNNEYSYYLGMTGTGINTGTLTILFDENKKVKDFKVTQG